MIYMVDGATPNGLAFWRSVSPTDLKAHYYMCGRVCRGPTGWVGRVVGAGGPTDTPCVSGPIPTFALFFPCIRSWSNLALVLVFHQPISSLLFSSTSSKYVLCGLRTPKSTLQSLLPNGSLLGGEILVHAKKNTLRHRGPSGLQAWTIRKSRSCNEVVDCPTLHSNRLRFHKEHCQMVHSSVWHRIDANAHSVIYIRCGSSY